MSHTDFAEVAGMVLVEVDAVMMLTTSKTTTSAVTTLSVLSDATLAVGDLSTHFSRLLVTSRHFADSKII